MKFLAYQIRHRTVYRYAASVAVSHHLVWLHPRDLPRQKCLAYSLAVEPEFETLSEHDDYFGNHCAFVTVEGSHVELAVEATSRVAVAPQFAPDPEESPAWETARALTLTDRSNRGIEALEFSYDSPMIRATPEVQLYAETSFTPKRPILDAGLELTQRIFADFQFDPAATDVATPLDEVVANRRGVCQDFAHFQIACFRSLGLPARYVSGYLETDPPPDAPRLVGADASHAWVSLFCPGIGWVDLDPTNGCLPTLRHITVAWGRDYLDVSPMRGVIHGGGDHSLNVGVDVLAEGPIDLASLSSEAPDLQTQSQSQSQFQSASPTTPLA